jgi:hypothetical protein
MWVLAGNIVQLQGTVRLHGQSETILVPESSSCGGICQKGVVGFVVCICTKTRVISVNLQIQYVNCWGEGGCWLCANAIAGNTSKILGVAKIVKRPHAHLLTAFAPPPKKKQGGWGALLNCYSVASDRVRGSVNVLTTDALGMLKVDACAICRRPLELHIGGLVKMSRAPKPGKAVAVLVKMFFWRRDRHQLGEFWY